MMVTRNDDDGIFSLIKYLKEAGNIQGVTEGWAVELKGLPWICAGRCGMSAQAGSSVRRVC